MGLSLTFIFILSIDICIESGQSVVNHVAVDKLAGIHVSGQHFIFVTVTVPMPCLWVPVTTSWRVLGMQMEEWPLIWRVAVNKWNKQSRTADKGWSSSLGVGQGANNSSP